MFWNQLLSQCLENFAAFINTQQLTETDKKIALENAHLIVNDLISILKKISQTSNFDRAESIEHQLKKHTLAKQTYFIDRIQECITGIKILFNDKIALNFKLAFSEPLRLLKAVSSTPLQMERKQESTNLPNHQAEENQGDTYSERQIDAINNLNAQTAIQNAWHEKEDETLQKLTRNGQSKAIFTHIEEDAKSFVSADTPPNFISVENVIDESFAALLAIISNDLNAAPYIIQMRQDAVLNEKEACKQVLHDLFYMAIDKVSITDIGSPELVDAILKNKNISVSANIEYLKRLNVEKFAVIPDDSAIYDGTVVGYWETLLKIDWDSLKDILKALEPIYTKILKPLYLSLKNGKTHLQQAELPILDIERPISPINLGQPILQVTSQPNITPSVVANLVRPIMTSDTSASATAAKAKPSTQFDIASQAVNELMRPHAVHRTEFTTNADYPSNSRSVWTPPDNLSYLHEVGTGIPLPSDTEVDLQSEKLNGKVLYGVFIKFRRVANLLTDSLPSSDLLDLTKDNKMFLLEWQTNRAKKTNAYQFLKFPRIPILVEGENAELNCLYREPECYLEEKDPSRNISGASIVRMMLYETTFNPAKTPLLKVPHVVLDNRRRYQITCPAEFWPVYQIWEMKGYSIQDRSLLICQSPDKPDSKTLSLILAKLPSALQQAPGLSAQSRLQSNYLEEKNNIQTPITQLKSPETIADSGIEVQENVPVNENEVQQEIPSVPNDESLFFMPSFDNMESLEGDKGLTLLSVNQSTSSTLSESQAPISHPALPSLVSNSTSMIRQVLETNHHTVTTPQTEEKMDIETAKKLFEELGVSPRAPKITLAYLFRNHFNLTQEETEKLFVFTYDNKKGNWTCNIHYKNELLGSYTDKHIESARELAYAAAIGLLQQHSVYFKSTLIKIPSSQDPEPMRSLYDFLRAHSIYKKGDELQGYGRDLVGEGKSVHESHLTFSNPERTKKHPITVASARDKTKKLAKEAAARKLLEKLKMAVDQLDVASINSLDGKFKDLKQKRNLDAMSINLMASESTLAITETQTNTVSRTKK